MRHLFQIFFGLLVPLSGLFMAASIAYFRLEYTLTKAIKLGVLSGVILGIGISFIAAIVIFISRAGTQRAPQPSRRQKKEEKVYETESATATVNSSSTSISKFMLLMDKTLAFEISRAALHNQKSGQISQENWENGELSIRTLKELVKVKVSSLTKHTTTITIEAKQNSEYATAISKFLKEKELMYLNY